MKQTLGALIFAGLLAAGVSGDSTWDMEKSFSSKAGQTLSINLRSGGDIHIAGVAGDKVNVKVRLEGADSEDLDVDIEQTSSGVEIRSEYEGGRRSHNASADIEVEVPTAFNVDFDTSGGDIHIRNVDGQFDGETMGGQLKLEKLKGNAHLSTMGGDIEVISSDLNGKVSTMGGDVLLRDVSGNLDGSTMGGKVVQEQSKASSSKPTGERKIHSMGGDLNVDQAPDGASLETMGGDIHVGTANDHVRAKTMGGDIVVESLDGWAELTTMGGDVEMKMTGDASQGKRDVEITSMGGNIEITMPANTSASFDLEIEYTSNSMRAPKITSDFPINIEESDDCRSNHDHGRNGRCRAILGTGKAGSGTNRVKIRTYDGDIIIKRS